VTARAPRSRARALPRSNALHSSAGVTAHARESLVPKRLPRPHAGNRDPRIQIGRGDAFRCRRGGQTTLRGPNVRPTIQEFVGRTERDRRRQHGIGPWREIDRQLSRRSAGQHRQPVLTGREQGTNGGQLRLDCRHACRRACHVLFLANPQVPAYRRQPLRLALIDQAAIEHGHSLLKAAQFEVIPRDIGCDAHAHGRQRGLEAFGIG
jgi:hypothetical protein